MSGFDSLGSFAKVEVVKQREKLPVRQGLRGLQMTKEEALLGFRVWARGHLERLCLTRLPSNSRGRERTTVEREAGAGEVAETTGSGTTHVFGIGSRNCCG